MLHRFTDHKFFRDYFSQSVINLFLFNSIIILKILTIRLLIEMKCFKYCEKFSLAVRHAKVSYLKVFFEATFKTGMKAFTL